MENNEIAKLIGKKLYNPSLNKMDFAIQLFVEKALDISESYTDKDIESKAIEFLNGKCK